MNEDQKFRINREVFNILDEMKYYWNTQEGERFYEAMECFAQELLNKIRFLKENDK